MSEGPQTFPTRTERGDRIKELIKQVRNYTLSTGEDRLTRLLVVLASTHDTVSSLLPLQLLADCCRQEQTAAPFLSPAAPVSLPKSVYETLQNLAEWMRTVPRETEPFSSDLDFHYNNLLAVLEKSQSV